MTMDYHENEDWKLAMAAADAAHIIERNMIILALTLEQGEAPRSCTIRALQIQLRQLNDFAEAVLPPTKQPQQD